MYNDESPLGGFLGLLSLVGIYFWGKNNGQQETQLVYQNQARDQEIMILKEKIRLLELQNNNQSI